MYKCPNCGNTDKLTVGVIARSTLIQDNPDMLFVSGNVTDIEWEGGMILCEACGVEYDQCEFDCADVKSILGMLEPYPELTIGQDVLDDEVITAAETIGSNVNNAGMIEQIEFLYAHVGPKRTEEIVLDVITAEIKAKE